eukprot:TRINITY_DN14311_c0_g1_i1.p2 TRINITY_DN14311_c0_g1~~TRINITY_DN14311_c0_g1_i1.p2  ORF type:complete len:294 (+),score=123.00 TRINITY_DN14311_c0_g1_i1:55-882(+)
MPDAEPVAAEVAAGAPPGEVASSSGSPSRAVGSAQQPRPPKHPRYGRSTAPGRMPVLPPDPPAPTRRVWGCSEHLWKRKGPSKATLELLAQREKEEAAYRSSRKVAGCNMRLAPKSCVRKDFTAKKKVLMPIEQAKPLNQRLYYTEVEREKQRASALHRKFAVTEPLFQKRSQDELDDSVKRMYVDETAVRELRRKHLLEKYVGASSRPPQKKLTTDDQTRSVHRLYTEAVEKQGAAAKVAHEKHTNSSCSPRRDGPKRTEAEWMSTVERLAART